MRLLAWVVAGVGGLLGTFAGATNPTELMTVVSAARRWISRLGVALSKRLPGPDVHPGLTETRPRRRSRPDAGVDD
jgi:hypothetical protein